MFIGINMKNKMKSVIYIIVLNMIIKITVIPLTEMFL